ncbi:hypothetical protein AMTR_s00054p00159220 [Amborella trichopoda]|uniref:Kinesin motor domain-containing protein n=1 Tax=Amborella trichopoda TaxID=13333 RepID=U5D6U2_AMBTC|nr:hypothetical protein AMTR_s00054p00159220 [Amborella trichopoda]
MSSRSQRSSSSISPFRLRNKQPSSVKRPATPPSSTSSTRPPPPSKSSVSPSTPSYDKLEVGKSKENVTVTVRFRPLSAREINKGDEIAWYADGDYTVQNEYNPLVAYGFDRVFGPATTTRHVYDVAAQHVVSGAMEGINGTVFAYGVTSSGKTHTMHGEQKSPGIIPLAVKDVFGIIQETPGREFLLRVSYLEIYNEVINDLLDPTGQNLRIREDAQGTYVEGIKEEVVLSPAHALSLIASGEEHRHVGSNNFNLLSSRSHTIFTLTIESSARDDQGEEDVTLSQLNLIDLAGSESSKTETTGLRRKEGSYINKSLLTLGTVIAKLTDGKATHIPYRDSKLTRLLQSSLSGHGRVSLICTLTPASSNSEETHNTLKFAHRSKHVEIKASQNKIMDEKSLIKKYQKEISSLKQELQQLKRGIIDKPYLTASSQEDLVNLKLQLEAGQVKLQSRLEEEEQAKAALMGRIQRLTKLILVSTKNTIATNIPEKAGHRRRHSFGEDELAYLPDRKREYMVDDDHVSLDSDFSAEGRLEYGTLEDLTKDNKKNRRRGMLGWFKPRKQENIGGLSSSIDSGSSASASPASCSYSSQRKDFLPDLKDNRRKSISRKSEDALSMIDSFSEQTQAGDLFSATARGRRLPPTGTTITDQMDLLREQVKMLAGEVALCKSAMKRLSEQAAANPEDLQLLEQIQKLRYDINEKKHQMHVLEQRMIGSIEATPRSANTSGELSQTLSKLTTQLNEKTFELEIKSADNRILQEQLQMKLSENAEMQETILLLRQQLSSVSVKSCNQLVQNNSMTEASKEIGGWPDMNGGASDETCLDGNTPTSLSSLPSLFSQEDYKDYKGGNADTNLQSQLLLQAAEIENLKQEKVRLMEEKDGLEIHSQKLAEEASYAKELASAAAVELRNLAEEVTKLSYQNAKLTADLAAANDLAHHKADSFQRPLLDNRKRELSSGDPCLRESENEVLIKLQKELESRCQWEKSLEATLSEKNRKEEELLKRIEEAKHQEEDLENELANMWVLVAKLRKSDATSNDFPVEGMDASYSSKSMAHKGLSMSNGYACKNSVGNDTSKVRDDLNTIEELSISYENEKRKCKELEILVSRIKGEDLTGLDITSLEALQSLHVEAITKICHTKVAL